MNKTAIKRSSAVAVILMLCLLISALALTTATSTSAQAAGTETTIKIGHVSDLHVNIEEYCNIYSDSYQSAAKTTKLLEETTFINMGVFQEIYDLGDDAPMYLFLTGDITGNGEYANLVWVANMLKVFTKRMRERTDTTVDFSGFQIFLSTGNHDIYNMHAKSYMPSDEELSDCATDEERQELLDKYEGTSVAGSTSKEFMDLFADFGYCSCPERANGTHLPSCGMADGCCIEYFFESDYWYDDDTDRDGNGLDVFNPTQAQLDAFDESGKDYNILAEPARFGACSYIARMPDFCVVSFDGNNRNYIEEDWQDEDPSSIVYHLGGWHESTGGMISENQLKWATSSLKTDIADGKTVFALGHTNFVPHFDAEDEIISLFTYDNWEQASYVLADAGIRYAFSGHQHAADIVNYTTQSGHVLYDIETGSLSSYGVSWRTMDFTFGTDENGSYYEDFDSLIHVYNTSPFTYGRFVPTATLTAEDVPLTEIPFEIFRDVSDCDGLVEYVSGVSDLFSTSLGGGTMTLVANTTTDNETGEEVGIADYLALQMYNMVGSVENGMAGSYVGEKIYDLLNGFSSLEGMPYISGILSGVIDGVSTVDLHEFSYNKNSYTVSENAVSGYDLADFTKDLAEYLIQYDFSGDGFTLAKGLLLIYGGHLSGAHSAEPDKELLPLLNFLESGAFVRGVITLLEDSLLPQLETLLDAPIRFDKATPTVASGFDIADALQGKSATLSGGVKGLVDAAVKLLYNDGLLFANTDKNGYSSLRLLIADIYDIAQDIFITEIGDIENDTVKLLAQSLRKNLNAEGNVIGKYYNLAIEYVKKIVKGEPLRAIIDDALVDKYVTDAFCKNLGSYGAYLVKSFDIDDTEDGSEWTDGDKNRRFPVRNYEIRMTTQAEDGTVAFDGHTYLRTADGKDTLTVTPSVSNGMLPGLISVSFNDDVATEKNVSWFTYIQQSVFEEDVVPSSYIRYSVHEDMSDAVTVQAKGENVKRELPTIDLGILYINLSHAERTYNRYSINLDYLKPGTKYYYRLGSDATGWSEVYTFATAAEGDFSFMAITDIQGSIEKNYTESTVNMEKAVAFFGDTPISFIISGGDNVDNGSNIMQYTWFLDGQSKIWANNTLVTTAGNHEDEDHALDSIVALPDDATVTDDTGFYYSYDYNNAHFIVLNTNDLAADNTLSAEQTNWLCDDLEETQENKDIRWTIVLLHKGPYTAGSHAFDADVIALRAQLTPIFAEYGVDLVLQGHDHTYSVSQFIGADGQVTEEVNNGVFNDPDGVLYVNLGTMGDKFYDYIYHEDVSLAERSKDSLNADLQQFLTEDGNLELKSTPVFAKIDVTKTRLTIRTYTIVNGETVAVDDIAIKKGKEETDETNPNDSLFMYTGIAAGGAVILAGVILLIVAAAKNKKKPF